LAFWNRASASAAAVVEPRLVSTRQATNNRATREVRRGRNNQAHPHAGDLSLAEPDDSAE